MVRDAAGYRLSEAFDLLPDVGERREHCLAFEYEHSAPTRAQLLSLADRWGVTNAGALIDAVVASVGTFVIVAKARAVPQANIDELGADLARRIAGLSQRC